ncbi:MAG: FHIPEP family type III secretion protein [Candidatus Eremiobacteraeota bacterium]|nr:FHIPEP family type III secretion protein [Candidatus Eremiobacteraeota bacterium]
MKSGAATYGFAAAVLGIVGILLVPLPPPLLDALLALDMLGSAVVLLVSITVADPLEFSAFAPALLIATLFRLALDVSATRLILTQGHLDDGVGAIVPAFGQFVVRGNLVVGLIVFIILIVIQFVVIAAGSQRVAEVAARFTLDAMPGKQMAIDADVHAGALDAEGARRKRALVQREADFYGAMDGAGKFIKGDAIAALAIVALNLAGGVSVGAAYHGMGALEALNTYAMLSIGNALVTTLPAFLLSTAMGLMVTRVAADGSLGLDLARQIFDRPGVLRAAGVFSLGLALVPALPRGIFAMFGCAAFVAAALADARQRERTRREGDAVDDVRRAAIRRPETALALVGVDALTIEFGADLAALLAPPACERLLDRIGEVRRGLAVEIGVVLPGVRLRDDLLRDASSYAIRVRDVTAGEGSLRLDGVLAVAGDETIAALGGERVCEPVYGMPACWLPPDSREAAEARGALVFDPISVVGSHLAEVAREHAAALVGRQELATLLEHLRASVPSLVKEFGSEGLSLTVLQRTFEALLRERVWPRDVAATLEAVADAASATRDPLELAEAARRRIVPALLQRREPGALRPLLVAPEFDLELREWLAQGSNEHGADLAGHVRSTVSAYCGRVARERAAVICGASLRAPLATLLRSLGVVVDVFAYAELPVGFELRPETVLAAPEAHSGQRPAIVSAYSNSL